MQLSLKVSALVRPSLEILRVEILTFQGGEEEKDSATVVAEKRFFQLLKQQKDERIQLGKPLVFNDED